MRWTPGGTSGDIEDRRDQGGVGGFSPMGIGGRGLGIGGLLILGLLSLIFKTNLLPLAGIFGGGSAPVTRSAPNPRQTAAEKPVVEFVSFVLDDAQDTWTQLLSQQGIQYPRAKMVLFRDYVQSACGGAQAASGPFYCPGDQKVYIDLSFYDELRQKFGASGDFAQAYVLAHEIGHHVQNVLGIERKVKLTQRQNPRMASQLSVALELQADCLAGVWGHSTAQRGILESGDAEEGLRAAAAIGDDRLQRMAGRGVSPESFTHGSSEQRVGWLRRGLESGQVSACDTFASR